jgi:hypothetical protein
MLSFLYNPEQCLADLPSLPRRGEARAFAVWSDEDHLTTLWFFCRVAHDLVDGAQVKTRVPQKVTG